MPSHQALHRHHRTSTLNIVYSHIEHPMESVIINLSYIIETLPLKFFISYGADVVEQLWSIDKYFEFVLLLMFSTGLAFQVPIIQLLLGHLGIVSSQQMLSGWRLVILGAMILGAVLTPSTDPLTQSLLAGAVLALYFGGIGLVKLSGK